MPIILVSFLCALIGRTILLPFHMFSHTDITSLWTELATGLAIGIALGIVCDLAFSILIGIITGVAFSIAAGIQIGITPLTGVVVGNIILGIAGGITIGIVRDIRLSIGGGITLNITGSIIGGIIGGTTAGIMFQMVLGSVGGIILGIAVGIIATIIGGIAADIAKRITKGTTGAVILSITGGIALIITVNSVLGISLGLVTSMSIFAGLALGLYRIPFYLISGPSALKAYLASTKRPLEVFHLLQQSSIYWDERVYLPLPYLKHMLLIAYDIQPDKALAEITFIAAERPHQLWAARAATLEIVMRDLETRQTIAEIAGAAQRLNELLPRELGLLASQWTSPLNRLTDASRDALRYLTPIGQQARSQALSDMTTHLYKVHPNVAFGDLHLNRRLRRIIETWLLTVQHEQEHLTLVTQAIGTLENPYKPGVLLEPHDPLFVGRTDLAQQLEQALRRGRNRPTLFLNGERRMGKTCTLQQLPYLLGSTAVPVFYNLQDPKLYASTTAFLGTLADGICAEMSARGLPVDPMSYLRLQKAGETSDPRAYEIFDHWLATTETKLEQEDRVLLLSFDEFEKLDEVELAGHLNLRLLLDWYRQIIQHHHRIALLFSGLRAFSEMGRATGMNWSSFFINVQTLKVSFLKPDEARQLILHPTVQHPGESIFDQSIVDEIVYQTNCHPFLVQAICSEIIEQLNREQRQWTERRDVHYAVHQALEAWNGYFDDLWKRTTSEQRACLMALQGRQGTDLYEIQSQSGLDENRVRRALQALIKRDLIVYHEEHTYAIVAPIFHAWVERNTYDEEASSPSEEYQGWP